MLNAGKHDVPAPAKLKPLSLLAALIAPGRTVVDIILFR